MSSESTSIHFNFRGTNYKLPIQVESSQSKIVQNLYTLFERKKGEYLRVNKDGLLVTVEWKDWPSFTWNRKQENQELKQIFHQTLSFFHELVSRQSNREIHNLAIQYLFDKKEELGIGRLCGIFYDNRWIQSHNAFSKALLPKHTMRIRLGKRFVDYTNAEIDNQTNMFTIDLGDKSAEKNLWKLLVRKKGQKYQIGNEGGRSQDSINEELRSTITDVITHLNAYLERQQVITRTHKLAIQMIFSQNGPLCRMSQDVFYRGAIKEGSQIEKILQESYSQKREALILSLHQLRDSHQDKNIKREVEAKFIDVVHEELLLMQKLGVDLEPNRDGGTGGARYAYNRFGKKILVIKPGDEGPHGVNNPQWYARFKRWLISPKACLEGNSEPLAELDSWACDRHFDIWSVPPTTMRYVESADFVGNSVKLCSLQMFVKGCKTLGEYIGVSPSMYGLPRPFLRWYCGSEKQIGFFSTVDPLKKMQTELLAKVPKHSLERVVGQDFLIENADCHFDNILVKVAKPKLKNPIFSRIFQGDPSVTDEEIHNSVMNLFHLQGNQSLLDQLLFSENVIVKGKKRNITLVKHDGGCSNPHSHSSAWDFLSIRFKYLFEVLPHFEQSYSEEIKSLLLNKEGNLQQFLIEKAERELRNILEGTRETDQGEKLVSDLFFAEEKNQKLLENFIFIEKLDLSAPLLNLVAALVEASGAKMDNYRDYLFYFTYHLHRIHGNIQTRLDCYRALTRHLQQPNEPMRTLFKEVRSYEDFERERAL